MMWQCHLSAQDYRYYPVDGYSLLKRFPLHPLSGPRCPVQTVGQWLESIGLPQYENHLMANGFDNVQFMGSNVMEDQDLLEIGILNSGHRQRILQAIQLLPKMRPIGHDGYHPTSVAEWLDSIELGDYTKAFLINGYTSMDLLKKIWDVELINVLKISLIGHRKRILASLGDRLHEDPPQKPPRSITLREPSGNHTPPQLSPSLSQSTYTTGGSLDVPHIIMQGDARRRRNENYFDDIPRSKLERQMAQNLAYEIILTLGQAFEVAYQLALQARKGGHSSTLPESFENKPSKPIPKPRVSIRKSVQIDPSEQKTLANLPWIVEPGQEAKRGINTKYETTIF
uniref:Ankyrin repeat and sterile alpha motif domain containing 1B n=1 Tax=Pipistrellus kuhlii TaxID=59472 RepID=A0A7J7ZFF7_PIPKU|nr:ankyrin repeat and sterile alpha motif domain containing 1B [Pipistrellus kuhlii]